MAISIIQSWNKRQLRLSILVFFIALAVPISILISQAFSQLKWEAFHRHKTMSNELIARIDARLAAIISTEEARPFTDYSFLNIAGDTTASFLQRSPLSKLNVKSTIPGLIGYFQINHLDQFSTPFLPNELAQSKKYGVSDIEREQRIKLQAKIYSILNTNKLVQGKKLPSFKNETGKTDLKVSTYSSDDRISAKSPSGRSINIESSKPEPEISKSAPAQIAFDQLNEERREKKSQKILPESLGRLDDLNLQSRYPEKSALLIKKNKAKESKRALRKERNILPKQTYAKDDADAIKQSGISPSVDIRIFHSEIDSIEISILNSGHLVLFRKVWRNGHRYIQGLIITTTAFLSGIVETDFNKTSLSKMSSLLVAYRGNILTAFSSATNYKFSSRNEQFKGDLLERTKLSQPFNDLELVVNIKHLPASGEGQVITATAVILLIVFITGFALMYWLGVSQIAIAQQQQDFVSAVSHELKTPLTSIRMYGELLREGWASDEKKKQYYEYIHDESERLSRLISNVLQLSRITHNSLHADLKTLSISELMDTIQSKISRQVEHANFKLIIHCDEDIKQIELNVDLDYFSQIFINLVDNALKFSRKTDKKVIDISCQLHKENSAIFSIRDYGPGIASDQIKKIFKLFYRTENELTRETVGTGIGLALVQQLIRTMNGEIDVINKKPGTEFRVSFPLR